MTSPFATLDTRLRRLPDPVTLAIGLALIVALVIGLRPDRGLPFTDVFLIPVAAVGWLTRSRGYGYVAALAAASASVVVTLSGPTAATPGSAVIAGLARLVLYLIVLSLLTAMRHMQLAHELDARTDPLTRLDNARAFRDLAEAELERSRRYRHELSLAYLDIDDFKAVNDAAGHAEGDRVLREVSHVLRSGVRSVDTVARLGGDEFAVLMPETSAAEARDVLERLRSQLARLRTAAGESVCFSIGLVTFDRPPGSLEELLGAGDDLMYHAKRNGKDRVEQAELAGAVSQASG